MKDGWDREKIIGAIRSAGYPAFQGTCSELYLEKCFKDNFHNEKNRLPIAAELGETNLTFLVHPTIKEESMRIYANLIKKVLIQASK